MGAAETPGGKISTLMTGKGWLLLVCALILAAIAILAASLHDVRFQPGRPLSFDQSIAPAPPPLTLIETMSKTPLWKLLLFWAVFVINIAVFFWLLPPEVRKRILRQVLSLALGSLAIMLALRYRLIQLPFLGGPSPNQTKPSDADGSGNMPLPVFHAPHLNPWWTFVLSCAVVAAVLLILWLVYRRWLAPAGLRSADLDAIRTIAEASLADLASGRDWGDVIVQSYSRMNTAVYNGRGLQRPAALTPREFAGRLQEAGLPAHAVDRLTRLFESVRYGARASTQADINEAVACLNSILQACGQGQ